MNAKLGLVNLRHRLKLNYSKVTVPSCAIEANIVDPDQTAPEEQSDLGTHCLSVRLQIFSGRQKHTFCDYAL